MPAPSGKPCVFVAPGVALLLAACGFSFEAPDALVDRRVLAMSAEPPELVTDGVLPATATVSALVADPAGNPAAEYAWSLCVPGIGGIGNVAAGGAIDPDTGRCVPGDATSVAAGAAPLDAMAAQIPLPPGLALAAGAVSGHNQAISLHVQTQLRVASPGGDLFAIKRIVVSPPVPAGRLANRNPRLRDLLLDGTPWDPAVPRPLAAGACEASDRENVADPRNPGRLASVCSHRIEPAFDPAEAEPFRVQTFDGQVEEHVERLTFNWFTDRGTLTQPSSAQPLPTGPQQTDPLATRWREPPGLTGLVRVWVVVRDGRGGESWQRREIDLH